MISRLHRYLFLVVGSIALAGCQPTATPDATTPPPTPKIDGENLTLPQGSKQIDSLIIETAQPNTEAVTPMTGRLTWNDENTVRVYTPIAGRVVKIQADSRPSRHRPSAPRFNRFP